MLIKPALLSYGEIAAPKRATLASRPLLSCGRYHRRAAASSSYNCHGLTFASRRTGIDNPATPVRVLQLNKSAAASDGVVGFRLIDGDEVLVRQIDGADRKHDRKFDRALLGLSLRNKLAANP
jgi:hypothetical protein